MMQISLRPGRYNLGDLGVELNPRSIRQGVVMGAVGPENYEASKRHIPFAIRKALYACGRLMIKGLQDEMRRVFDNPTPWTVNSLYMERIKGNGQTTIVIQGKDSDFGGGGYGTPSWRYLFAERHGGPRELKPSEFRASTTGTLGGGPPQYWIPTARAPLDQYGNVRAGLYVKIMQQLGALEAFNPSSNEGTARTKRRRVFKAKTNKQYFVEYRDNKPLGIFHKMTKGAKPLRIFTLTETSPEYKPIFHFEEVGLAIFDKNWHSQFSAALKHALETAH